MFYDVNVSRIIHATMTIRVEADSPEKAEEMAVEQAHDEDFTGCVTDYEFEANGATPVTDPNESPNPMQAVILASEGGLSFIIGDPQAKVPDTTCALCDAVMPETVEKAIEAGWIPSYFDGDDEQEGPVCPACVEHRLKAGDDGELELKHD